MSWLALTARNVVSNSDHVLAVEYQRDVMARVLLLLLLMLPLSVRTADWYPRGLRSTCMQQSEDSRTIGGRDG